MQKYTEGNIQSSSQSVKKLSNIAEDADPWRCFEKTMASGHP